MVEAADRFGLARGAVEDQLADALVAAVTLHPAGIAVLDSRALASLPFEILWRLVSRVVTTISGDDAPPRYEAVLPIARAIAEGTLKRRALLGVMIGMSTSPKTPYYIYVCREPRAWEVPVAIAPKTRTVWDKRFLIMNNTSETVRVGVLNAKAPDLTPPLLGCKSGSVLIPALYRLEELVAAPHIGVGDAQIYFYPTKPLADPRFITRVNSSYAPI